MGSIYEGLCEKLARDPRLTKKGGARFDLSLLLFNARASLFALWRAAERCGRSPDAAAVEGLRAAVEDLRPIFGERNSGGRPS